MVKRVTVSLGSILADAKERGHVGRNVIREMKRHRRRGKDGQGEQRQKVRLQIGVDFPAPAEIRVIVAEAIGRWRPLIITAIFTGLRASELRGLRWVDVDFKADMIHVRQRADRYNEIGSPKSGMSHRTVPMPPMVINSLMEWKLKCPKGELGLAFPNGNGNVEFHRNVINRGLIPTQIKAGVCAEVQARDAQGQPLFEEDGSPKMIKLAKYPGLHALRHFYASWCINRKVDGGLELPPKIVQAYLGHEDIKLTMDTYGHLFPQTDTAEAFAAAERSLLSA